jgi:hypothetical protein
MSDKIFIVEKRRAGGYNYPFEFLAVEHAGGPLPARPP